MARRERRMLHGEALMTYRAKRAGKVTAVHYAVQHEASLRVATLRDFEPLYVVLDGRQTSLPQVFVRDDQFYRAASASVLVRPDNLMDHPPLLPIGDILIDDGRAAATAKLRDIEETGWLVDGVLFLPGAPETSRIMLERWKPYVAQFPSVSHPFRRFSGFGCDRRAALPWSDYWTPQIPFNLIEPPRTRDLMRETVRKSGSRKLGRDFDADWRDVRVTRPDLLKARCEQRAAATAACIATIRVLLSLPAIPHPQTLKHALHLTRQCDRMALNLLAGEDGMREVDGDLMEVEQVLAADNHKIDPNAASRLRPFLAMCRHVMVHGEFHDQDPTPEAMTTLQESDVYEEYLDFGRRFRTVIPHPREAVPDRPASGPAAWRCRARCAWPRHG